MKTQKEIIASATRTLTIEANAILNLVGLLNTDFYNLVTAIYKLKGRVIITGVGKSAIVAQKIVATLNSTGTPAIFMHSADAIHGDLGIVQPSDLIICVSKSGNTPEIKALMPLLKQSQNKIACLVGNTQSYLAQHSNFVISTFVEEEACPYNLAPTSSTTAQMAMGDALAVALLECREFTDLDFAKYHPGGALGKKLHLKVSDLVNLNPKPTVNIHCKLHQVILEITNKRLGMVVVLDHQKLVGIITDGDLRRMMEHHKTFEHLTAKDIMSENPITIDTNQLATKALNLMTTKQITQIVVTQNNIFEGVVHLHDLLKEDIL